MPCACHEVGAESDSCEPFGGQCRCRPNVIGRDCSMCATGFWGFPNCRPCNCGTRLCEPVTGDCICPPRTLLPECTQCEPQTFGCHPVVGCEICNCSRAGILSPEASCDHLRGSAGTNRCKDNVVGRQCDRCAPGFYGYPNCRPCDCNDAGTEEDVCNSFNGQCLCKENVQGPRCDQCRVGTFHLDPTNPKGCTSCFCFGATDRCRSSDKRRIEIMNMDGWVLLGADRQEVPVSVYPGQDLVEADLTDVPDIYQDLHWHAPKTYLGDKVSSYGGSLRYRLHTQTMRGDALLPAESSRPDVILKCLYYCTGNKMTLVFMEREYPSAEDPHSGIVHIVEKCAPGYYRDTIGLFLGKCVPCNCNGHSDQCLDGSGICMNCRHNTAGEHCEKCQGGFMGNNTLDGHSVSCASCPCPLSVPSNNFAEGCVQRSDRMQCLCMPGYAGPNCERCAPGYYGNPMVIGSRCEPCHCNDNTDSNMLFTDCHSLTGECLGCMHHSAGTHCEICEEGYYGDAIHAKNCTKCSCSPCGTESCDPRTGQCRCKPGVTGPHCDRCEDGTFGFDSCLGCRACDCEASAALLQPCDPQTGACSCQPGVNGPSCKQCAPGHWDYGPNGCKKCSCRGGRCDPRTGECRCPDGMTGKQCDTCTQNYSVPVEHHHTMHCEPCDSCVIVLLEDLDKMNENFTSVAAQLGNLNASSIAWAQLNNLNKTMEDISRSIENYNSTLDSSRDRAEMLDAEVDNIKSDVDELQNKASAMSERAGNLEASSNSTHQRAEDLLSFINNVTMDINDILLMANRSLNATDDDQDEEKREKLLNQAQAMLREMRFKSCSGQKKIAEHELTEAQKLLDRVFDELANRQLDNENTTHWIKDQLNKFSSQMMDLRDALNEAVNNTARAEDINTNNEKAIEDQKRRVDDLVSQEQEVNNQLQMAEDDIATVNDLLSMLQDSKEEYERLAAQLDGARTPLAKKVDSFAWTASKIPLVEQAEKHAEMLNELAMNISNLVEDTKKDGFVDVTQAYNRIINSIKEAEDAANMADKAATDALKSQDLGQIADSLKNHSIELKEEVEKLEDELNNGKFYEHVGRHGSSASKETGQASEHSAQMPNISESINRIRELIQQARNAASKVGVPVKFNGTSGVQVRNPSNLADLAAYTNLKFYITLPETTARKRRQDELNKQFVFYLGNKDSSKEFLGMALEGRRLRWFFNIGGDTAEVLMAEDVKADGTFNSVVLERILQYGQMSMSSEATEGDQRVTKAYVEAGGDQGLLSLLTDDTVFYVGGYPSSFTPPEQLALPNFKGCIELDTLNEEVLSLYNFENIFNLNTTQEKPCGRLKPLLTQAWVNDAAYFDGTGFAQVAFSGDGGRLQRFEQEVRLVSHNGILLLLLNQLELIILRSSPNRLVVRNNRNTLYNELIDDIPPFTTSYYLGGVPEDKMPDALKSTFPKQGSLKGCFRNVKALNAHIDLKRVTSSGVSFGCDSDLLVAREAHFSGQSYLDLALTNVPSLRNNFYASLGFRTDQKDGLMFYHRDSEGLCQVFLNEGHVVVRAGNSEIKTQKTYNDNNAHYVALYNNINGMRLYIDDMLEKSKDGSATSRAAVGAATLGVTYLGGTPDQGLTNLTGCISNVFVKRESSNQMVLDLLKAKENVNVPLKCPAAQKPQQIRATPPKANKPKKPSGSRSRNTRDSCQSEQAEPEPGASHFSGSTHSYHKYDSLSLNTLPHISLSLRINSSDGLVLHAAGGRRSKTVMSLSKMTLRSRKKYNDDQWHTVFIKREGEKLSLVVDGISAQSKRIPGGDKTKLSGPLYIGGLPATLSAPGSSGFVGCVKDLKLNDAPAGAPTQSQGTVPCFQTPLQPGAYFSGHGGHITIDQSLVLGEDFNIQLEVRPVSYSGLLLHAGTSATHYLTVVLNQGEVMVSMNSGEGDLFTSFSPEEALCNGRWHTLTVMKKKNVLTLQVDSDSELSMGPKHSPSSGAKESVYLGGVPGGVAVPNLPENLPSFHGCIRLASVNQRAALLSKPLSVHGAVGTQGCPKM
ncbi:hypothetical protein WMY93_027202 [Mugilogobius chulae]|uniref:Laminin subunit alpha-5 n=1 Tax=Mugilogobius chulae TaxID=88201 RepID=A0AAW0MS94_9GOBI